MKTYYDSIANGYDELHGEEQRRKLAKIQKFIPKGALILDVGCGTGLSKMLGNVMGVDPSIELLKLAKIPIVQGVGENLPFKNNSVDVIICMSALHNFSDYRMGISEMKRVSREVIIISLLKKAKQNSEIKEVIEKNLIVEKILDDPRDTIFVCRKTAR